MPSVTALSGVNWTDLNGSGLSAAQETQLAASISQSGGLADFLKTQFSNYPDNVNLSVNEMSNVFSSEEAAWARLVYLYGNASPDSHTYYANYIKDDGSIGVVMGSRVVEYLGDGRAIVGSQFTRVSYPGATYSRVNGNIQIQSPNGSIITVRAAPVTNSEFNNPFINLTLATLGWTADTRLSLAQRELLFRAIKEQRFIEASKLSIVNGGGIKTHNGSWYVNGEKVSYLEITLAVRVNQLYVVNESITEQLKQVQQNNKKIKFANTISSIIANKTPANSSGTQNIDEVAASILLEAIKEGVIPASGSEAEARAMLASAHPGQNSAALFRDTDGRVKFLMRNWDGPTWSLVAGNHTATEVASLLRTYAGHFNLAPLKNYFPNSFSKLFNTNSIKTTGTLTQTECTTMTTELKSIITSIDSNNQVLQTQLSQYNDKRTEVLDSMSSIIKGHNGSMAGIGRNLSAT